MAPLRLRCLACRCELPAGLAGRCRPACGGLGQQAPRAASVHLFSKHSGGTSRTGAACCAGAGTCGRARPLQHSWGGWRRRLATSAATTSANRHPQPICCYTIHIDLTTLFNPVPHPTFGQAAAVGAAQRIGVKYFQHAMPLALPQRFRPRPAAAAGAVAVAGGAVVAVQRVAAVAAGRQARNAAVHAALPEMWGGWRDVVVRGRKEACCLGTQRAGNRWHCS